MFNPFPIAVRSAFASALIAACIALPAATRAADADSRRVRGTVGALSGNTLTVRSAAGADVDVALDPDFKVLLYSPIALQDIAPNAYVGVASAPQGDGTFKALAIVVFPEAMRGRNEGAGEWDLLPGSRMTNATVARVADARAGELTLRYQGDRTQRIALTDKTPVATFVPAPRDALAVGAKVIVFATRNPDGSLKAGFVGVGKDGYTPPL